MRIFSSLPSWGATTISLGIVAVLLFVIVTADSDEDGSLHNGLGKHIQWHSLDEGLSLAYKERKPLMLLIHKSWCGACKSLKPKFRDSKKIAKLSKNFIMVNTMDDDEPPGDLYKPDGGYVPRLFFFDPEGELLKDVINEEGNPDYKYYYYDELSIVTSMEKVSAKYSTPSSSATTSDDSNASVDDQNNKKDEKDEL